MQGQDLGEALALDRAHGRGSLVVYLMVDRHRRRVWVPLAEALRAAGVAGMELGVPFSDPIADGPVLQAAASQALADGTNWNDLLEALEATSPILPTTVMTYANVPWQRGLARAFREMRRGGAGALIVPDISFEESSGWRREARRAGLGFVLMASPATSLGRARELARLSQPFLYLVGQFGTTGQTGSPAESGAGDLIRAAHAAVPDCPVLVGFGVQSAADAKRWRGLGADGVIVGSAPEARLGRKTNIGRMASWVRSVTRALRSR